MILPRRRKIYPSLIISEEKIQVLRLDKEGKRVTHLAEEKLVPSVIVEGQVKNIQSLADSLKRLFQTAKISERLVVVGIPENKCYTKVITLPKLKTNELAEAVIWEAETYLPVPLDQVYVDWKIIDEKEQYSILLIAVPKEIIETYTESLKLANLIPIAFESTALSLVRLVEKQNIRALIIEVQQKHAVLTLTNSKAIEASSIIAFEEDVEKSTNNLIETINKMLKYYESKKKDLPKVETLFVCGEAATNNLLTAIAEKTERQVHICPIPVENLPQKSTHNFAVVASLAMKDIQAPKDQHTINLLPAHIQEEFDKQNKTKASRTTIVTSTIITSIIFFSALAMFIYINIVKSDLESAKLELPLLPAETGKAIIQIQRLNKAAKLVITVGEKRTFPQSRLASILPAIPERVNITSISIDETQNKIRIVGVARTRADLLTFKDNIQSQAMFSEPILPLSSLQLAENIDFLLTATINEDGKE